MDFASRALENGHVVMKIDGPNGFTVVVAGPAKELPRFEKALSAVVGEKAGPSRTKKPKKQRPSTEFLYDENDAVWTVCAHGFGATRNEIEEYVDSSLIDSAIEAGALVVDGTNSEGEEWIRIPDAAEKEQAVFDAMREKAESHKDGIIYRQACGPLIRAIYPEYYSTPFFRALMDAAANGPFVEESVVRNNETALTYCPIDDDDQV